LGIIFDGYKNKFVQHEIIDGVQVTHVWTYITPNKGTLKRMINFIVFMFLAVWMALFQKRPDIIIGSSPQFFAAWAGLISSRLHWRRVPFIAEIRDLWPDSIVTVGAMKNKKLLTIIYWLEKLLYRWATHLVTVGPGYAEDLKDKGVLPEKISMIPNGVDKELFFERQPNEEFQRKYGLNGKISCAYIGTIGMAAGLEIVLNTAEQFQKQNRNDIQFFLIGDGAEREKLQMEAEKRQLNNLVFTGMIPKNDVPGILATMDICLVHLKKKALFTRVLPSKIFEIAAMKKPIILGVEGFAAQLIQNANAGICIEPENVNDFLNAIELLVTQPELRKQYGEHGQQYVLEHYDRQHLAKQYLNVMESMVECKRISIDQ
jgi:glycosyltransferase involved in cell wall biosynthesis